MWRFVHAWTLSQCYKKDTKYVRIPQGAKLHLHILLSRGIQRRCACTPCANGRERTAFSRLRAAWMEMVGGIAA